MSTQTYVNSVTLSDATEFNRFDTAAYCYLTGAAGTNTITATGPANMTLATPQHPFVLVPAVTNSGATTLNITPSGGAALGAKSVFCNGVACVGGELMVGIPALIVYDGTQYQIIGPFTGILNAQALVNHASATPANGSVSVGLLIGIAQIGVYIGSGTPSIAAAKGSLYLRSNGSTTNDRAYINTDGSTTWTAVTTVA